MKGFQTPTPKDVVKKSIQELDKVISLKGKKFLDFGCGKDERIAKEAKKFSAKTTAIDKYFGKKIDGLKISWEDFDVVFFSYGIDEDRVVYKKHKHTNDVMQFDEVFGLKATELSKNAIVAILFEKSDFLLRTKTLPTDKNRSADAFPNLKAIGNIKHIKGEPFDMYLQLYKKK